MDANAEHRNEMCEYSRERVFSILLHQCQRQGVVWLVNFITVVRTDHFAEIETHRVNNMANGSYKCAGEQYLSWVDKGTTIAVTPHCPILLHNHLMATTELTAEPMSTCGTLRPTPRFAVGCAPSGSGGRMSFPNPSQGFHSRPFPP